MDLPLIGRIYRHFKGGCYRVVMIVKDHDNLRPVVIYQSTGGDDCYARPLESFSESVGDVKRFELIQ